MKISIIQMNIQLGRVKENRIKVEAMVREAAKENPDVIVLPETWNAGFFPTDFESVADLDGQPSCGLLSNLAKEYKVNIIGGSVVNSRADKLYNTNYVFNREGEIISRYDKVHRFSLSGEDKYFEHGESTSYFEIDGIKASTIICYDIRFPELSRTLALGGAKILFVPAEWPIPRIEHWRVLLRARAIENQFFVVGVNITGFDGSTNYGGSSTIIDPWGKIIADAEEKEVIITREIDLNVVDEARKKMNIYGDRQPSIYKL